MFCNKRIKKLKDEINVHHENINKQQRMHDVPSFNMTMIELSKESSLAQLKNNELTNIQFKRNTILAITISTFSILITCVVFIIQITDNVPTTKWQNEQTKLQQQLSERNKNLTEIFTNNNSRLDSLIKLNHELVQLMSQKNIKQEHGK